MSGPPRWYTRDVSRETSEALAEYAALIEKWTRKINLISPSTIPDIMDRHIWDSAQIYGGQQGIWADLGSGGGLPGIVIAILRKGEGSNDQTILIESDQRKATFLRTCVRSFDLNAAVVAERIEMADPAGAHVISARALINLTDLILLAHRHMAPDAACVLLKGARWREEIAQAEQAWRFSCAAKPSKTNPEAAILEIRDIERV
ncbi:16S rRNA (guanine(527)-N(7))-methyltransferase RsmG [uncultured Tateyamaria sp.]|uniref:16S rRNA (guanine(527)-N(7))-methyltransferase RsmG n=1 Tax=Tateyamaria sp. 1078 TaxID=3417464 RepID=UPI0026039E32|nr:16S rRNA (guanine(527)-N(7))-methyltransferase RsmG [uncultured Tateyamaria sp.]